MVVGAGYDGVPPALYMVVMAIDSFFPGCRITLFGRALL